MKLEFIRHLVTCILIYFWSCGTKYRATRFVTIIVLILNYLNSLYYFKLIDGVAPFISTIFMIFNDIAYFMFVYVVSSLGVANLFWLMGRIQTQDENIDPSLIDYNTVHESIWWVWNIGLGLSKTDSFFVDGSEETTKLTLEVFFYLSSFVIVILLLNMLIAIMGDTFNKN